MKLPFTAYTRAQNPLKLPIKLPVNVPRKCVLLFLPQISGAEWFDSSENSNSGTIYTAKWANGRFGYGLEFNGSTNYVQISDVGGTTGTSPHSVSMWFKTNSVTGIHHLLDSLSFDGQSIYSAGTTLRYERYSAGTKRADCSTALETGQWYQVVTTFDSTNGMKIYLNGSLDGSNSNTGSILSGYWYKYIGKRSGVADYFDGFIDEVAIYNRVLTAAEIKRLYNWGKPR